MNRLMDDEKGSRRERRQGNSFRSRLLLLQSRVLQNEGRGFYRARLKIERV